MITKRVFYIFSVLNKARKMTESPVSEDMFTVMGVDGWNERWKNQQIGFHKSHIHQMLEKYVDKLINNRQNLRIFIPLCGKTLDIKWLYDQGHTLVGVEGSEMALQQFFEEQSLEYTSETVDTIRGKLYKSKDGRIRLYCCDIYMFNKDIEGQFDGIWDRGSFVAINRQDREKYSILMLSLMAPNCQYLLDTFDYNEKLYAGPPHYVPVEQILSLYGGKCNIEQLDIVDCLEEKHIGWGLDYMNERLHLLTLKIRT